MERREVAVGARPCVRLQRSAGGRCIPGSSVTPVPAPSCLSRQRNAKKSLSMVFCSLAPPLGPPWRNQSHPRVRIHHGWSPHHPGPSRMLAPMSGSAKVAASLAPNRWTCSALPPAPLLPHAAPQAREGPRAAHPRREGWRSPKLLRGAEDLHPRQLRRRRRAVGLTPPPRGLALRLALPLVLPAPASPSGADLLWAPLWTAQQTPSQTAKCPPVQLR
mmetsp:Transcript_8430/g.18884  ORF Transcript_8430/g.18884 Transcript_8430/m.18884 type:complete len:218 (+) Transcript_8430:205-858(+)